MEVKQKNTNALLNSLHINYQVCIS